MVGWGTVRYVHKKVKKGAAGHSLPKRGEVVGGGKFNKISHLVQSPRNNVRFTRV